MYIGLFNSRSSLPPDDGDRILVFAGVGSLMRDDIVEIVTEIHCTYKVGETNTVEFLHNGDATSQRFEQALVWAIKYATKRGIKNIYAIFELSRPLDHQFLDRNCPDGITDCRPGRGRDRPPCARSKSKSHTVNGTPPRQLVLRQRALRRSTPDKKQEPRGGVRS